MENEKKILIVAPEPSGLIRVADILAGMTDTSAAIAVAFAVAKGATEKAGDDFIAALEKFDVDITPPPTPTRKTPEQIREQAEFFRTMGFPMSARNVEILQGVKDRILKQRKR